MPADPLSVGCPYCHSAHGKMCRDRGRLAVFLWHEPHPSRVRLAERNAETMRVIMATLNTPGGAL